MYGPRSALPLGSRARRSRDEPNVEARVKVNVERASDSEAILKVELEWPELEKASERAYRKLAQRYTVPGFRPGHAPRSILERMVGRETIYQEGLEALIDESYREAIRTNNLRPVGEPELDAAPFAMNETFTYTAKVPVLAPVKLGDYQNVRVEHPGVEVTDDDIAKILRDLQEQQALWIPVERPAQVGDRVIADLKLTVGDRTISDLTENEFELADERQGIFSGMDQQLVGMSEGDTKEFDATIPDDYGNAELAGKAAQYVVTLKGVKYHELPELDDEFAKSAGDYESLESLRAAVREQLTSRRRNTAERDFRDNLLKAVAESSEVEIAHPLVHQEADTMVREMQRMLQQTGLSWEAFLGASNKTAEQYRDDLEPEAQERVKRKLVLDAIADAESITANDTEIETYLQLLNVGSTGKPLRLRQLSAAQRQFIVDSIRRDKATTLLVERAGGGELAEGAAAEELPAPEDDDEATAEANATRAARAGVEESAESPTPAAPHPNGKRTQPAGGEITAASETDGDVPLTARTTDSDSTKEGAGAASSTSA
jgi:trigger factor